MKARAQRNRYLEGFAAGVLVLLLGSCNGAPSAPAAKGKEAAAPGAKGGEAAGSAKAAGEFRLTATIQDIMDSMVDPKADNIWNSVATIVTLQGTEEKRPRTDEDWAALRRDAITLVEATNLLLMEGRVVAKPGVKSENPGIELEPEQIAERIAGDRETWKKMVGGLYDVSLTMLQAIDAKDVDKLFDHGGDLDGACESCHRQYWYPDPSTHGPPPSQAEKALQQKKSADAGDPPGAPGVGTIQGHVHLTGKLPGNAVIRMGMDPKCAEMTRGKQVVDEQFALKADGSLGNVFVKLAGKFPETPVPAEPVKIAQKECLYAPRVLGARVGQNVQFENDDPLLHNVHGMGAANTWNLSQPIQGMTADAKLAPEDGMLQVKCDVHRWMTAWIGVVDHPYFAVTDRDGAFTIRGVPAGEHTLVAWHEKLGTLEQKVGVKPGATASVELTYSGAAL